MHGVQFHPESIGTPIGKKLVARFLAPVAIAGLLVACGGAEGSPPKAPAPAAPSATATPERDPTSVAEAQEQIDHARAELSGTKEDKDSAKPADTAPGTGVHEERSTSSTDTCASSCRALSSMRRAVNALCRMTGDEDTRCSDAKKTLSQSESRVARCHCGQ